MAMQLDTSSSLARSKAFNVLPSVNSKEKIFIELQRKRALTCEDITPSGWDPILLHFPMSNQILQGQCQGRVLLKYIVSYKVSASKYK